jgi:hypothetical protein|tara:strand:- start:1085 stop:1306 length:222 start_codon:yes stop_codon:yes gene_type:complete
MNRVETITEKVGHVETGLNGSLFVHVDHVDRRPVAVRYNHKWKDGSGLDGALTALGDVTTAIIEALNKEANGR